MAISCIGDAVPPAMRVAALLAVLGLPATVAHAAGPHDGQYAGTRTSLAEGDGSVCAKTGPFSVTVTDNQFEYTYNRQLKVMLRPVIAADGSFSDRQDYMLQRSSTAVRIKGRIEGGALKADIEGTRCQYRLDLKKR